MFFLYCLCSILLVSPLYNWSLFGIPQSSGMWCWRLNRTFPVTNPSSYWVHHGGWQKGALLGFPTRAEWRKRRQCGQHWFNVYSEVLLCLNQVSHHPRKHPNHNATTDWVGSHWPNCWSHFIFYKVIPDRYCTQKTVLTTGLCGFFSNFLSSLTKHSDNLNQTEQLEKSGPMIIHYARSKELSLVDGRGPFLSPQTQ